jgi:hypothetical protein
MKKLTIVLALIALAALPAAPLLAQQDCNTCDLVNGLASTSCGYCADIILHIDTCDDWEITTCGEHFGAGLADNCSPAWSLTESVTVGQYGQADFGWNIFNCTYGPEFSCEHHKVDRNTWHDLNQCNISSNYWDMTTCLDYTDYWSGWQCQYQNCCAYPFYCNDWHSCY